jgi:hypothetical protein
MKDPSTLPDHNIATNRCENISTGEARSRVLEKTSKPTTTAVLKGDDRRLPATPSHILFRFRALALLGRWQPLRTIANGRTGVRETCTGGDIFMAGDLEVMKP